MAFPSVTYTFTNGSTADATQVNQNYTDLINGLSDGTKSLNISALTIGSTGTFNNNVVLGLSSSNTITHNGSMNSSIPVNTNSSYDLGGASLGFRSLYLGSTGSFTFRQLVATQTSSYSLTWPDKPTVASSRLEVDTSGVGTWVPARYSAWDARNIGLTAPVSGNALTINLKGWDAADPSSVNSVNVPFRSSTATTGTPNLRQVQAALSLTLSTGTSLGLTSNQTDYIYVYLVDSDGTGNTMKLGAASVAYDDGSLANTVTESFTATVTIASPGVFTATSHGLNNGDAVILTTTGALPTGLTAGTKYFVASSATNTFQLVLLAGGSGINTSGSQSGTHTVHLACGRLVASGVYANAPIRLIGRLKNNQTTAGTYAAAISEIALAPFATGRQIAVGTAITSNGTSASATFAAPSNQALLTFIPGKTGRYKISFQAPIDNSGANRNWIRINNDVGSPTVLFSQEGVADTFSGALGTFNLTTWQTVYLTAGTSYNFKVEVKTAGGTLEVRHDLPSNGCALIAECMD